MNVSAIIPTFYRPAEVLRAVHSALAQSHRPAEVIVVVDGRDDATVAALRTVSDPALRVLVPERHLGNASARNYGVAQARGEWVAFLDDDDEWLPSKLQLQLEAARAARFAMPIIACRLIARTSRVDLFWPRRLPRDGEPLCDYMCRRSLPLAGEGLVQSSMIVAPRALFERVRFCDGLPRHVDSDWVLRAVREPGVGIVFPHTRQPLAIWNIESSRTRVSTIGSWRDSLAWARSRRELFTPQAYAGFVCKNVSALAAAAGDRAAFFELLREVHRTGRASWVDLTSHVMNFMLPPSARDMIWRAIKSNRPA